MLGRERGVQSTKNKPIIKINLLYLLLVIQENIVNITKLLAIE